MCEMMRYFCGAARDVHVTLEWRKESLQPIFRGGVRKVSNEDLFGSKTELRSGASGGESELP
jgi:hypothetical protein